MPPVALPSAASRSRLALRSASDTCGVAVAVVAGAALCVAGGASLPQPPATATASSVTAIVAVAAHDQKSSPTAGLPREGRSLL